MTKYAHQLFLLAVTVFALSAYIAIQKEGTVDIYDKRKQTEPEGNVALHKIGDVEAYRTDFLGGAYKVIYYREDAKKLRNYQAYMRSSKSFDKAAYSWINDTLISIRFFHTTTGEELKFRLYGNGERSGMAVD